MPIPRVTKTFIQYKYIKLNVHESLSRCMALGRTEAGATQGDCTPSQLGGPSEPWAGGSSPSYLGVGCSTSQAFKGASGSGGVHNLRDSRNPDRAAQLQR